MGVNLTLGVVEFVTVEWRIERPNHFTAEPLLLESLVPDFVGEIRRGAVASSAGG